MDFFFTFVNLNKMTVFFSISFYMISFFFFFVILPKAKWNADTKMNRNGTKRNAIEIYKKKEKKIERYSFLQVEWKKGK